MPPRCWIDQSAYRDLFAEARKWQLRETGGALLGWRDGDDAVVAQVLGPGPNAIHKLRSFEPDGEWQTAEGRKVYEATERKVAYLGEWHTHPLGPPYPSGQDRAAAREISEDPAFRAPSPLSAILGRARRFPRGPWRAVVYVWLADGFVPMEIEVYQLDPEQVWTAESRAQATESA